MSLNTLLVSEDENPNLVSPAVQVAACHVIRLFCTSLLKSDQATKTSIEPFPAIYMTFALAFLCRTRCDTLNKVLIRCSDIGSKCVQLKSCAPQ